MRVTTAFNRILALPGADVASVKFTDTGVVLGIRRRARLHRCPCGEVVRGRYDLSRRRWRHLDLGACPSWLEADIARIDCPACGRVRTEAVPWARPGARHTRDFEDLVAWLAQRLDKTNIARLLRCSWSAVNRIVINVVADTIDDTRLDGLVHIGVDEVAYKRGHRYLTIIADHDTGNVVWVAEGANQAALTSFFEALGPERCAGIEAISLDMASRWTQPVTEHIPQATVCFDPFHVIKWGNDALDAVYRTVTRAQPVTGGTRGWRRTRTALRTGSERLDDHQRQLVNQLRRERYGLWRAWDLKERLRDLYRRVDPADARAYLRAWCTAATRSRLPPFINLATRYRRHFDGIVAAVEHDLSNGRLEGLNSNVKLINRRARGHRTPEALTAMIYLCLGGITVYLPTQT